MRLKLFVLLIGVGLLYICCTSSNSKLKITPLSPFVVDVKIDDTTTKKTTNNKIKYFLLENYVESDPSQFDTIDSFVLQQLDSNLENLGYYSIYFYKESDKTNSKFIESPSDDLDWHADDLVLEYMWLRGKFTGRTQYKDRKVINPKFDVKVE